MTFEEIRSNPDILTLIEKADGMLGSLGFTEHSTAHTAFVSDRCAYILSTLGYSAHIVELARIASWMHDIGNLVNRVDHSQSGALMAFRVLDRLGMPLQDIAEITAAIGNHDEGSGQPVSPIAAALILADKSDVRRSRVRNRNPETFDIHDRVNYSVTRTELTINEAHTQIDLKLTVDTLYSSVMDYFQIFMNRMQLCQKAAQQLGLEFQMMFNEQRMV